MSIPVCDSNSAPTRCEGEPLPAEPLPAEPLPARARWWCIEGARA